MRALTDATEDLGDPDGLRARLDRDSYLYLPGLLDRAHVQAVRDDVTATLDRLGWLREGEPVDLAVPSGVAIPEGIEPRDVYFGMYAEVQRLQRFHELAHDAALQAVLGDLFGETVLTHPMKIMRVGVPTPELWTTPSHQDFPIIDGTVDFVTAWIPLGDVETEMGGLKVLPGSHRVGRMEPIPTKGIGGIGVAVDEDDDRFCTADYAAGDVLLFHSLTVHGALPNRSHRTRLSADYRFQGLSQPLREYWLHPHYHPVIPGWDELTEGWTSLDSITAPEGVILRDVADPAPVTPALVTLD
jgi:hypothetical protein